LLFIPSNIAILGGGKGGGETSQVLSFPPSLLCVRHPSFFTESIKTKTSLTKKHFLLFFYEGKPPVDGLFALVAEDRTWFFLKHSAAVI
jgi:hypothetical protein